MLYTKSESQLSKEKMYETEFKLTYTWGVVSIQMVTWYLFFVICRCAEILARGQGAYVTDPKSRADSVLRHRRVRWMHRQCVASNLRLTEGWTFQLLWDGFGFVLKCIGDVLPKPLGFSPQIARFAACNTGNLWYVMLLRQKMYHNYPLLPCQLVRYAVTRNSHCFL